MSKINSGYGLSEKKMPSFTTRVGKNFDPLKSVSLTLCSETT
jgi:hypothetical protein